jgi:hypothetical protein
MCLSGIDQFIDIGSGLPTADNTHQVAQRVIPGAHVVFADIETTAVVHGQALLAGNSSASMIAGSVMELDAILNHAETQRLIDKSKPVGILLSILLHFFSVVTLWTVNAFSTNWRIVYPEAV